MRSRQTNVLLAMSWKEPGHVRGISRYAYENGWLLDTFSPSSDDVHPLLAQRIQEFKPRGIISQLKGDKHEIARVVKETRVPIVELCWVSGMAVPMVVPDADTAGALAAANLLERGLANFVVFAKDRSEQQPGFLQAVRAAGHEPRIVITTELDSQIAPGTSASIPGMLHGFRSPLRRRWAHRFFTLCDKPVGVFTHSAPWASDIIEGCRDAHILVPEQVAVISVADTTDDGLAWPVPLTVVAQNYEEQGYQAARLLDRMMKGAPVPQDTVVKIPPHPLVQRASSMCYATTNLNLARAVTFIMRNLHNPGLCVKQVLSMTTITHTTFHREFVREFKVSPARYIEDLRVKDAVHLLETTDATASAIAVHCGFDNLLRFRCTLKRRMGMGPALYRKRQGERLKVKGQGGREQQGEGLRVKGERLRVKGTVGSGETHPSVPSQEGKMEGAPRVSDSTKQPELKPELRREPIGVRVLRLLDKNPLGKKSLSLRLGQKEVSGQLNKVIRMLLADHAIEWTIPGKPNSKMQQYRLTDKGHTHLAEKKLLPAGS